MDSEQDRVLGSVSSIGRDGVLTEAADKSPDLTKSTTGRSGSKRSTEPALSSRPGTERVLRARVAKAGVAGVAEHTASASRKRKHAGLPAERRKAAVSRSRDAPVTHNKSNQCVIQPTTDTNKDYYNEDDLIDEESSSTPAQIKDNATGPPETIEKKKGRAKGDKMPGEPKRRKKSDKQYVRCELEGCGVLFSSPHYLKHHIRYQHLLKKTFVCNEPSCGRMFRFQKQLLRHAKSHSDQRDFICEHCSRAFKSPYNLAVHKMIHTGEKPIQCEICGFTCRQRASLTWHMKKHDAEASYKFSCSICGQKFEKKYSVISHKAKIHPEVLKAEDEAATGGSVTDNATLNPEKNPNSSSCPQASLTGGGKKAPSDNPLQQGKHIPQGLILNLQTQPVLQVWHLTPLPQLNLSTTNQQQVIQLPLNTNSPSGTVANSNNRFPIISSVTSLAVPQTVQKDRKKEESDEEWGEGELWEKVVVGETHQD